MYRCRKLDVTETEIEVFRVDLKDTTKVPFHIPFSVAEIVIHMQRLHQTAALSQNKELVWVRQQHLIHSGFGVFSLGTFRLFFAALNV